jgi:hypothetical protein
MNLLIALLSFFLAGKLEKINATPTFVSTTSSALCVGTAACDVAEVNLTTVELLDIWSTEPPLDNEDMDVYYAAFPWFNDSSQFLFATQDDNCAGELKTKVHKTASRLL